MSERSISKSGAVAVNGAQLAYDQAGGGPVLVLMHAGICDRRMWDAQVPAFARSHRVVRYDVRGFGASSLPPGVYAHQDDLRALLDALGIERATLVAVSMAGAIALKAALTYPERAATYQEGAGSGRSGNPDVSRLRGSGGSGSRDRVRHHQHHRRGSFAGFFR